MRPGRQQRERGIERMNRRVSRRTMMRMAGGVGLTALTGCQLPPDRLKPTLAAPLQQIRGIDVHCHIFNARDIPVVRFLEKVVLPDFLPDRLGDFDRRLLQPRAALIGHGLEELAKSYDEELRALAEIAAEPE